MSKLKFTDTLILTDRSCLYAASNNFAGHNPSVCLLCSRQIISCFWAEIPSAVPLWTDDFCQLFRIREAPPSPWLFMPRDGQKLIEPVARCACRPTWSASILGWNSRNGDKRVWRYLIVWKYFHTTTDWWIVFRLIKRLTANGVNRLKVWKW